MVTARQAAGFRPSLSPAAASQESCRDLALSYPRSAGIAAFLSPGEVGRKDQTCQRTLSKESGGSGYREEPQGSRVTQKKQGFWSQSRGLRSKPSSASFLTIGKDV